MKQDDAVMFVSRHASLMVSLRTRIYIIFFLLVRLLSLSYRKEIFLLRLIKFRSVVLLPKNTYCIVWSHCWKFPNIILVGYYLFNSTIGRTYGEGNGIIICCYPYAQSFQFPLGNGIIQEISLFFLSTHDIQIVCWMF